MLAFRIAAAAALALAAAPHPSIRAARAASALQGFKPPTTSEMEKTLLQRANQARREQGLSGLQTMPALERAARRHSRDMARRRETSHLSGDGKTLSDRLVAADVFFVESGENVAFSETFVADFIHAAFMESPEHRDNLLFPSYDRVGIGVEHVEEVGYYVTQAFIRGFEFSGDTGSERHIRWMRGETIRLIDEIRTESGLPPLERLDRIEVLADRLAALSLKDRELPEIPGAFGAAHILFLSATTLEALRGELKTAADPFYRQGGLGLAFGRDPDHPGGTFQLALILLLEKGFGTMSPEEHRELLLERIRDVRRGRKLPLLRLIPRLSREAERMSRELKRGGRPDRDIPSDISGYRIVSYVTQDLLRLPDFLPGRLESSGAREVGIGIAYAGDRRLPAGQFWVTIIF